MSRPDPHEADSLLQETPHRTKPVTAFSVAMGDDTDDRILDPLDNTSTTDLDDEIPLIEVEPQLTWRSVIVGCFLGLIVCTSNIYFSFKTSMSLGSSFTGAILGFAILALFPGFNIKENCTLTSACTAAGGFAAGYATAIPALMWLGKTFTFGQLLLWTISAGFLGVFYMPPMRKHMIIKQNLPFPSGTATAVVLVRLHEARREGMRRARSLLISMIASGVFIVLAFFVPVLYYVPVFLAVGIPAAHSAGFYLQLSPAFIASGVFTGLRNSSTMFIAALISYGICGPAFVCRGSNDAYHLRSILSGCSEGGYMATAASGKQGSPTYGPIQQWWLWVSIAIMFADQITGMLLQYKSIASAFSLSKVLPPQWRWSIRRSTSSERRQAEEPVDPAPSEEQVPAKIWASGFFVSSIMCVIIVTLWFDMRLWEAIVAILFGIPLAVICIQCTGETDTTPLGAVGKMSQLLFAILTPHAPVPNLMAANIAACGAAQSTDVMQSFKTGHILQASPRAQFYASIAGCFFGVFGAIGGWYLFKGFIPQCAPIVPECRSIAYPAPAAQVWYNAAILLSEGVGALPRGVVPFTIVGLVYGAVAAVLKKLLAPRFVKYIPSSIALALGILLGPALSIDFFLGAVGFWWWQKRFPSSYTDFGIPIASGMIAGEGLAGILQGIFGIVGLEQGAGTLAGCYGFPC